MTGSKAGECGGSETSSPNAECVSARRTACCEHGYPLDFSGRVIGGKALFSRAVGGVGW